MVFSRSGLCSFPSRVFRVPIWFGLVVWYPVCTRLFNTPSLSLSVFHKCPVPEVFAQ